MVHDAMKGVCGDFKRMGGVFVIDAFKGDFIAINKRKHLQRLGEPAVWPSRLDNAVFVEDSMVGCKRYRQVVVCHLKHLFD